MKINKVKVVLFFTTALVGFLIALNFNFERTSYKIDLDTKQYQHAVETRNKLQKQVAKLHEINDTMQSQINKYEHPGVDSEKVVDDMKKLTADYGMLTGLNECEGPGIVITIKDGSILNSDTKYEAERKVLHYTDMANVLNEIRFAGGEAIAINNHRISPMTAVACQYAFIGFEDEDSEYAPFNIYVIGDSDTLQASLLEQGSYINRLNIRGLSVDIKEKENIRIPAANLRKMEDIDQYIGANN